MWAGQSSRVLVKDDGHGMSEVGLVEAMRFGRGARVRELVPWDRIKLNAIMLREPSGYPDAPRFTPLGLSVWPKGRC